MHRLTTTTYNYISTTNRNYGTYLGQQPLLAVKGEHTGYSESPMAVGEKATLAFSLAAGQQAG